MTKDRAAYWESIYKEKNDTQTSWFQPLPDTSLALIDSCEEPHTAPIIDVGGGNSRLVDLLIQAGWSNITVLDVSHTALNTTKQRLGPQAEKITWREVDLLDGELNGPYRIWHDRAVFHFLTADNERQQYLHQLESALEPGGHCIIATFDRDGPETCSGLPVQRYSPMMLTDTLGGKFRLIDTVPEQHPTPAGKIQSFIYCRFNYQNQTP